MLWGGLYHFGELILKHWPVSKIRERAVKKAIEIIHWEDENTRYLTPGCVHKVSESVRRETKQVRRNAGMHWGQIIEGLDIVLILGQH